MVTDSTLVLTVFVANVVVCQMCCLGRWWIRIITPTVLWCGLAGACAQPRGPSNVPLNSRCFHDSSGALAASFVLQDRGLHSLHFISHIAKVISLCALLRSMLHLVHCERGFIVYNAKVAGATVPELRAKAMSRGSSRVQMCRAHIHQDQHCHGVLSCSMA